MFKDSKETIIKLIDFGYAGFQADEVEYMFGTYGYFAPECLD
jgi:serine/threonine protein kinase